MLEPTATAPATGENILVALSREMTRVHDLDNLYAEVGPAAAFARASMRASITAAEAALNSGDVVAIIAALKDLQGYHE